LQVPSVFAEVAARAVRLTSLQATQGDAVRLAGLRIAHEVIAPWAIRRGEPAHAHLLLARPLLALGEGPAFELLFVERLHRRGKIFTRFGEAQRCLFLQHVSEHSGDRFGAGLALAAGAMDAIAPGERAGKRHHHRLPAGARQGDPERVIFQDDVFGLDFQRPRLAHETGAVRPEPFARLGEREMREAIAQGGIGSAPRGHVPSDATRERRGKALCQVTQG
jgi:hypothetical protein